jgi:hypothetical protein
MSDVENREIVIDALDGLHMWRAAKPGVTLFGSLVGRVLLTSQRFLFLSTGTSGIGKEFLFAAAGGPLVRLTLGQTTTDQLDLSALGNEGSLSGRLEHVTGSRVVRRWDLSSYLVVETAGTLGLPPICSFMTRLGFNRGRLLAFRQTLESTRTLTTGRSRRNGIPSAP